MFYEPKMRRIFSVWTKLMQKPPIGKFLLQFNMEFDTLFLA